MSAVISDAAVDLSSRTRNYILISADTHCGGAVYDYRPYLEKKYHERFDEWAAGYHDPWAGTDRDFPPELRLGTSSFDAPMNWDSELRQAQCDKEGVVAEVLFPNTAPPFYPSNAVTARSPRNAEEYELRWAGFRAHNRWLADFCNLVPGRRAGLVQVFLNDADLAIDEIRKGKEAGLMGVLVPGDHVTGLNNLYYREYDPVWALCEELDMPVHRHGLKSSESAEEAGVAAVWVGSIENGFFGLRPIAHMICAGVFERFPNLKFVLTEMSNGADVPSYLARIDRMVDVANSGGFFSSQIQNAHKVLHRKPSEYYDTNIFMSNPIEFEFAYNAGTPNLIWGSDMPHAEGCSPYTKEALRLLFHNKDEAEVRELVGRRAIKVYGFDEALLQSYADKLSPSPADVARALTAAERPNYPMDTRCLTFSSADTSAFASK